MNVVERLMRAAAAVAVAALFCCAIAPAHAADSLRHTPPAPGDSNVAQIAPPSSPQATAPSSEFVPRPFDMITNLPGDWVHWGKETFTADHLPIFGLIAAGTAATLLTDRQVYDAVHAQYLKHPTFHDVSETFTFMGDGKFQFGVAALFAAYGFAWDSPKAIRTASQTVEVILACGGVVQLLKHTTGRESPFTATQRIGRWDFFPNQIDYAKHVPHYDAYPSGHVATAVATLTVITENYPDQQWIPWIGYPAIAGLAMGMVANGIHWWSDYPLSIALGYSFGKLVAHPQHDEPGTPGVKTSFAPTLLPNGVAGVAMTMQW